MKIEIQEFCIRCGLCEDLYPELFHLNIDEDKVDVRYEGEIPDRLKQQARQAARDCAIGAILLR